MSNLLQIHFRGMEPSEAVQNVIQEKFDKLYRHFPRILRCEVLLEAPHQHQHKGGIYHVHITIKIAQGEVAVSREPEKNHAHEDAYVAIRDAFAAAEKQLQSFIAKQRGIVKIHENSEQQAVITSLFPDYGFIHTPEGREIYFHKNSVISGNFADLAIGKTVRFQETSGEQGPQASFVEPIL
jgi:ribosomal subunit interface protein